MVDRNSLPDKSQCSGEKNTYRGCSKIDSFVGGEPAPPVAGVYARTDGSAKVGSYDASQHYQQQEPNEDRLWHVWVYPAQKRTDPRTQSDADKIGVLVNGRVPGKTDRKTEYPCGNVADERQ